MDDDNNVRVEKDINSLTDFSRPRDKSWCKNRVVRIIGEVRDTLMRHFPPNKYDNNERGWNLVEATGRAILEDFERSNAITNVDAESDFLVDRVKSRDDYCYITVGAQAVDSIEKFYFTLELR